MVKLRKAFLFSFVILSLLFTVFSTRFMMSAGASSPGESTSYSLTLDTSSKDASISSVQWSMDTNLGANWDLGFGFVSSTQEVQRFLVQFDLPPELSGAIITSATLKLYGPIPWSGAYPSGEVLRACRVTHDWVEGTGTDSAPAQDGVTWNEYNYWDGLTTATNNWGALGGDYTLEDSSTVTLPPGPEPWTWWNWAVTNIVQGWVSGTYSNYGFLVKFDSESLSTTKGGSFHSKEYSDPDWAPKLEITYVRLLELQSVRAWCWTDNTGIEGVTVGDVDGDSSVETVTGGYYYDGVRFNAQLCVWSGASSALEKVKTWYWTAGTYIESVAVGDVDGDGAVEIVTGGEYYDGTRYNAQLVVWNGSNLALENVQTWYWTADTKIFSVAVGDVDGDGSAEIVTGGYYVSAGYIAQLCVWDGATLALKKVQTWYWTSDTGIWSVVVGDVDADGSIEIITGGYYYDGVRFNAQLCVWSGATLAVEDLKTWYWTAGTYIESVAVGDVDGDGAVEIVTGGEYYDGTRYNAQLVVWNGSNLALEHVTTWYWTGNTYVSSVAVSDVDGDGSAEIVTGGYYVSAGYIAQLCVWRGSTLASEKVKTWYWIANTFIYSVAVGDIDADGSVEIVTGGAYDDGMRYNAQLAVWGAT